MLDEVALLESILNGSMSESSAEELRRLATFVGSSEDTVEIIDRLNDQQWLDAVQRLFTATEGRDDDVIKFTLRLIVNMANRSDRHRNSFPPSVLVVLRDLLVSQRLLIEAAAVLTTFAKPISMGSALDTTFDSIVAVVANLWMNVEDDNARSWLSAFLAAMLEEDGAFLANAFGELPPTVFTMLLHAVEALSDRLVIMGRSHEELKMHSNNVQMLFDVLMRARYDHSYEAMTSSSMTMTSSESSSTSSNRFLSEYPEQLPLIVSIIANLATRRDLYDEVFARNEDAIDFVVDLLDVALHSEGDLVRLEDDEQTRERESGGEGADGQRQRPTDRPPPPPAFFSPRVHECSTLTRLSDGFKRDTVAASRTRERLAELKCATVRAIGNISSTCGASRVRAGARGAVVLCLAAAKRNEHDNALVTQWSVAALRYLCIGCPPNQQILASIDSAPTGIIDRENLLAQLGVRVVTVEDEPGKKRAKLLPL